MVRHDGSEDNTLGPEPSEGDFMNAYGAKTQLVNRELIAREWTYPCKEVSGSWTIWSFSSSKMLTNHLCKTR